jgi:hypothetical protein
MTLSDSEGKKEDDLDSLEWEQQVSADDEQTFESSDFRIKRHKIVVRVRCQRNGIKEMPNRTARES